MSPAPPSSRRRRRRAACGLAAPIAALWAVTWAVNRSLVAVRGPSMLPTLPPGQRLLTVPAGRRQLRAGDVVVVEDPGEPGHLVIKRIARIADAGAGAGDDQARVLVLGDNPGASTDGRHWGPLPRTAVRRVVVARWPSLSRGGLTGQPPRSHGYSDDDPGE